MRRLLAAIVLLAGVAVPLGTATPAGAASTPHYVAIVVDGSPDVHACVKWTSGISGDTVLNDVAKVTYAPSGLINRIDGYPSSGSTSNTYYWSYWHDTGSSWTYADYGASSSHPAAGTVEGWAFDDGSSSAPPPTESPKGLYASMCGAKDAAASGSTPAAKSTATRRPVTASSSAARGDAARSSAARSAASSPARRSAGATPSRTATRTPSASGSSSPSPTPATTTPSPASLAPTSSPAPSSSSSSSFSASPAASSSRPHGSSLLPLLVGLALIVVLGGGAFVATRLRRHG